MGSRVHGLAGGTLLAVLLLTGCGEVSPLGARPKSDQFLTPEQLAKRVQPGTSREAILRQLGEPAVSSGDGRALAYARLVTAERKVLTLAVVVPFWSTSAITYFQVQGIWLDGDGRVVQTRLWNGHNGPHGGNPYEAYRVPSREHLLRWLEEEAPGSAGPR